MILQCSYNIQNVYMNMMNPGRVLGFKVTYGLIVHP